jgi:hypothetical protein
MKTAASQSAAPDKPVNAALASAMTRRKTLLANALLALTLVAGCPVAQADPGLQIFLDQTLTTARDDYRLPAVAALVQIDGKIVAESAVGLRSLGCPEAVTTADRWHIGSDTKASQPR